eukprot:TRINITY_DN36406_c0_g1_i2.p1 TRINITY_DN36406_c0_g1~~TRINITY_DN36406_c0_g1_i2.p1  ORF type:complete len:321 (+),score=107.09 TRINITY_DN36406_c0_g1_i2:190-1152(+)
MCIRDSKKTRAPVPLEGFSQQHAEAASLREVGVKRTVEQTQKVGSVDDDAASFFSCVRAMVECRGDEIGGVSFDKDDQLAMDFVVAAANLRARIFGIAPASHFKIKSIAGAIIPAIATTNAIVSGLIVVEVLKLLQNSHKFQMIFVTASSSHPLSASAMPPPNPNCLVCRDGAPLLTCWLDTTKFSLSDFVTKVLKDKLGFLEPSIDVSDNGRELCLFEDPEESAENLPKIMSEFYLGDNAMVSISDYTQDLESKILISHRHDLDEEEHPGGFQISAQPSEKHPASCKRKAEDPLEEDRTAPKKQNIGAAGEDLDDLTIL